MYDCRVILPRRDVRLRHELKINLKSDFFNLFLNCLQAVEQHVAMCGMTGAFELLQQARLGKPQRVESFFELSLFR